MTQDYGDVVADFRRDILDGSNVTNGNDVTAPRSPVKDIDEEIKVTKKRKPVPKLDENRLLSNAGIPTLRKRARRLKFGGKHNEYVDMEMLLGMYQEWMDDMYPRAKFRDGAAIIEKLGHSKRLNVMRKAWMQDTRPIQTVEESEETMTENAILGQAGIDNDRNIVTSESGLDETLQTLQNDTEQDLVPDEDELDALLAEEDVVSADRPFTRAAVTDIPPDDELDALLAEEAEMMTGGL